MKKEFNPLFIEESRKRMNKEVERNMTAIKKMDGPLLPQLPNMDYFSENDAALIGIREKYRRLLIL